MSDLLSRVTEARKKAMGQFLKDLSTHEVAVIVKSEFVRLESMAEQAAETKGTKIEDEMGKLLARLFSRDFFNSVKYGPKVPGDELHTIGRQLLANTSTAGRYERVADHIQAAYDLIKAYPLNDKKVPADTKAAITGLLSQLKDMYPNAINRASRMFQREINSFRPEVLALQGGGEKGAGYVGVAKAFDEVGLLKNIKYVAGTSAGALMGLPIALGFSSSEINDIVKNGNFAQFFAESTKLFRWVTKGILGWDRFWGQVNPEKRPYLEGMNLIEFADKHMLPALANATGISERDLKEMRDVGLDAALLKLGDKLDAVYKQARENYENDLIRNGRRSEARVLQFSPLPGRSEALQACVTSVRSVRSDKHPENDLIESYLGDLIEIAVSRYVSKNPQSSMAKQLSSKPSFREINFNELAEMAKETNYRDFKELGVAITRNHMWKLTWFPRAFEKTKLSLAKLFNKDGEEANKHFGPKDINVNFEPVFVRAGEEKEGKMTVKKAVRISMNLPVLFNPIEHEGGYHIDGGMNNNYPHRMFRDKFKVDERTDTAQDYGRSRIEADIADEKTAGFILSPLDSDMENFTIDQMAKVAKKKLSEVLAKYPAEFVSWAKDNSLDLMRFTASLGVNIVTLKWGNALGQIASAPVKVGKFALQEVGKGIGKVVDYVMDRNNAALPSEVILENTGVISTGTVGTGDFHIGAEEKEKLIRAGERAAYSLLSNQSDRHLRFSKDRLISLIAYENELLAKEGKPPVMNLASNILNDPYLLTRALIDASNDKVELAQALGDRIPGIVERLVAVEPDSKPMLDEKGRDNDDGLKIA